MTASADDHTNHVRRQPYNERMPQIDLVVVGAFASQVEADLAKSALESAGIDAMIQADRAGGMRDHLAWSGFGFKILVRDEDAQVARDILKPPPESKLVFVQSFATQADADVALGALLSAGIVRTIEDTVAGVPPSLTSITSGFRVLVPEQDAAAARAVLKLPSAGV
jgi:hypothetical protein